MIDLTPLKPQLNGKPIAIVGLGRSGMPVFEACKAAGIETLLWDDNETQRKLAADNGGTIEEMSEALLKTCAFLCLSPGIPLTHPKPHPAVTMAKAAGTEIICDIELFHRVKPDVWTIGITGTNGKSTTTALIGHILKQAKIPSAVGGNIGQAVLSLPDLRKGATYVLELSSYQIDLLTTFRPNVSVMINFSADHLDRHGSMAGYIAVKEKLFTKPAADNGIGIIGIDDEWSAAFYDRQKKTKSRKVIPISFQRPLRQGVYVAADGMLFDGEKNIVNLHTCPALKGQHNWQNAAMAYTACRETGVGADAIIEGLQSFPGLAHRQNIVTAFKGVTYINDSKATNDQAAAMALRTFTHIYWIAGGKPKDGGYKDCEKYLGHVHHAFLIGEAEPEMAEWLTRKKMHFTRCGNLATATVAAHRMAQKEKLSKAVVLLAPACASFDQFNSFEHRGEVFIDLVKRLTEGEHIIPSSKHIGKKGTLT